MEKKNNFLVYAKRTIDNLKKVNYIDYLKVFAKRKTAIK